MEIILGIISVAVLLISSLMIGRIIRPGSLVGNVICVFIAVTGQIILTAFILSALNLLSFVFYWALLGLLVAAIISIIVVSNKKYRSSVFARIAITDIFLAFRKFYRELPGLEKWLLTILLVTVLLVNILNLTVVLLTAPHTWDSLAYRLAQVGYYLQHNNIDYFDANYEQQVVVQKNAVLLLLYAFIVSGRNENLAQLVQFIAYWVAICTVYGVSREIGLKQSASLFAALIFALLTLCITQSTTTQSDMLIAAFIGVIVYSLLAFRNSRQRKFLLMAGIAVGLVTGVKATVILLFPSLTVIAAYIFFRKQGGRSSLRVKNCALFLIISLFSVAIFALPSGYWSNYRVFKHPLGPETFRKANSIQGQKAGFIIRNGMKSLIRYGLDFLTLDGLPPVRMIRDIQKGLRYIPQIVVKAVGIDLESDIFRTWFNDPPPLSHEDYSSWGIFGFALIWPAIFLLLFGSIKAADGRILAVAVILFIVVHSYSGVYIIGGRARYLLISTVYAVPLAGYLFLPKNKLLRFYITVIITAGCVSGLTAVLFRYRSPVLVDQSIFFKDHLTREEENQWPLPLKTNSLFLRDRLSQVLRDGPIFDAPIRKFEELVPPEAVVAACLNPNSFEYPLFGYKLTRTIIPINSFWRGLRPIPPNADYLLWADDFDKVFKRHDSDIHLGKDWYLRELK